MSKTKLETTKTEIPNPYHPHDLEWGTWFYHDDIIKQIKAQFETQPDNKSILIHGRLAADKTRILKKIDHSPEIIEDNYITIYLDLREFMKYEPNELLFYIAREVIKKLKIRGYAIPEEIMDAYRDKKSEISDFTVTNALLTIDSLLESKVLLLVIDEFDELLKYMETDTITEYIQYFMCLEKSWNNYALIIGVKHLDDFRDSEVIQQFLDSVFKINLEKYVLKKKDLEKLIREPIGNDLIFSENAVKRIIRYSGKNLYFQQLICYFLVHYINEKERSHCESKDIEYVVERILEDQKGEFNKSWKKELSVEMKLIASALVDEKVTEKRINLYHLTENQLLEAIFGEQIYEKVKELYDIGFIEKIHGRHFSQFPFKIPLFGLFIRREHPFIKTVVENIDATADRIALPLLLKEVGNAPTEQLNLFDKEAILYVAEEWVSLRNSIVEKRHTPGKREIEEFLKSLSNLLNLKMNIDNQEQYDENYLRIDIKNLNIGILEEAFCFIQNRAGLTDSDIFDIKNRAESVVQDTKAKLILFFYFQNSSLVDKFVKENYLNFIVIGERNLTRIILSNRPQETFRRIILGRLSLQSISPYQTEAPARATFYGRSGIINRIIGPTTSSFSIVGSRRIGKSSLLHKINDNSPPNTIYIFMNLELAFHEVKGYNRFLMMLEAEIEEQLNRKIKFGKFPLRKNVYKLHDAIKAFYNEGKKIIFIFDEVDQMLEFDKKNDFKLMRLFRTMSQQNYCRFIFAGFKELYRSKRKIENPMYNFCEEIILYSLDKDASLDLITKPMESIGVHYNKNQDRDLILEYTARHPSLLQFFCKQLMKKVENHPDIEERRTIFKNDIVDLFDNEYQKYIMDELYMFFSDLSPINRLILIMIADGSSKKNFFKLEEIKGFFMDHGIDLSINEVHQNLRELVVRFILIEQDGDYRFALPNFTDILGKSVDIYSKKRIIKEIKYNVRKSL
jgi:hypothetical protein